MSPETYELVADWAKVARGPEAYKMSDEQWRFVREIGRSLLFLVASDERSESGDHRGAKALRDAGETAAREAGPRLSLNKE